MTKSEETVSLVDPLVEFTSELFGKIRKDKDNAILSPISVHKALNLVLLGAGKGSQSQLDLIRVLGYGHSGDSERYHERYAEIIRAFKEVSEAARKAQQESKDSNEMRTDKSPLVEIWNMVVAKNDAQFKETYLKSVEHFYSSSANVVHDNKPESKTKLLNQVNRWAKEAGFDSEVLTKDELDQPFSALLMSAIQVEAFWFGEFHPNTRDISFYNYGIHEQPVRKGEVLIGNDLKDGAFVEFKNHARYSLRHIRLLEAHQESFKQVEALDFHIVKVPLRGGLDYLMLEPSDSANGSGLSMLINKLLEPHKLAQMLNIVDSGEAKADIEHLEFPSFKFQSDVSLNGPLKRLGLHRIFDEDLSELSEMMTDHSVYIDEAKHQAVVEVNENGLKAAAITKMFMCRTSAIRARPLEPIRLTIKNPFMFIIRHQKLPLFIGQVVHF